MEQTRDHATNVEQAQSEFINHLDHVAHSKFKKLLMTVGDVTTGMVPSQVEFSSFLDKCRETYFPLLLDTIGKNVDEHLTIWCLQQSMDEDEDKCRHLLFCAVGLDRPDIIQVVMKYFLDRNVCATYDTISRVITDAIHLAAMRGDVTMVGLLANYIKYDPKRGTCLKPRYFHIHETYKHEEHDCMGPIQTAAYYGHVGVINLLVERGWVIDRLQEENNLCIRHYASSFQSMVEHYPLHIAVLGEQYDVVQYLVEQHGLSFERLDDCNATVLYYVRSQGMLKFLNEKYNIVSDFYQLHYRSHLGSPLACIDDPNLFEAMITAGIDLEDHLDLYGGTVLFDENKLASADIVRYILRHGIDLDAKDNDGDTVLHVAAQYKIPFEVMELLVDHGAPIDVLNNKQQTPYNVACSVNANVRVRELLRIEQSHPVNHKCEDVPATEESGRCIICQENIARISFVGSHECHVCRRPLDKVIRIFL
ncbi:26S proteasome non-ATPase regulatory subunit 10 [Picochlorum sp. SENEW3]|nr:26S proteasome non-ATPase regulatory subunit 10 [Picochlorum sp. SENEW3]